MTPKAREDLYSLLREYHEAPAMKKSADAETEHLAQDLERIKDVIVSMSIRLTRGNGEFKDWSTDLRSLSAKTNSKAKPTKEQSDTRKLFDSKISQLLAIVELMRTTQLSTV